MGSWWGLAADLSPLVAPDGQSPLHHAEGEIMRTDVWGTKARLLIDSAASIEAVTAAGLEAYVRERHLPRVLPVGPDEIADDSIAGHRRIAARLARALRAERMRGRGGHWTYDLNRHIALRQAYLAERRWLEETGALPSKAELPRAALPAAGHCVGPSTTSGVAAVRGPSSWPAPNAPRRSSGRPSDNPQPGPISRGIPPAKGRNGSAGGASAT